MDGCIWPLRCTRSVWTGTTRCAPACTLTCNQAVCAHLYVVGDGGARLARRQRDEHVHARVVVLAVVVHDAACEHVMCGGGDAGDSKERQVVTSGGAGAIRHVLRGRLPRWLRAPPSPLSIRLDLAAVNAPFRPSASSIGNWYIASSRLMKYDAGSARVEPVRAGGTCGGGWVPHMVTPFVWCN